MQAGRRRGDDVHRHRIADVRDPGTIELGEDTRARDRRSPDPASQRRRHGCRRCSASRRGRPGRPDRPHARDIVSIWPLAFDTTPSGTPAPANASRATPRLGDHPSPQPRRASAAEHERRLGPVGGVDADPVRRTRRRTTATNPRARWRRTSPSSRRSALDDARRRRSLRRTARAAARSPSGRAAPARRPRRTGPHRIDASVTPLSRACRAGRRSPAARSRRPWPRPGCRARCAEP